MKKKTPDTTKIYSLLESAGKPISANRISRYARVTYDSVSKRIHDLRLEGYDIKTLSRRGVNGARYTTYAM